MIFEILELFRALNFKGSELLPLLFVFSALVFFFKIKIRRVFSIYLLFPFFPFCIGLYLKDQEHILVAISILIFTLINSSTYKFNVISPNLRFYIVLILLCLGYTGGFGTEIYDTGIHTVFQSQNAFVYYLLLNVIAVILYTKSTTKKIAMFFCFLSIQSKATIVLMFTSKAFLLISPFLGTLLLYNFQSIFGRIIFLFEKHEWHYALTAGRSHRFLEYINNNIDYLSIFFGPGLFGNKYNFEIEFIDFFSSYGLIYTLFFFIYTYMNVYYLTQRKLLFLVLFTFLNLSGHFWNNPLLVVTFLGLLQYEKIDHFNNVSRQT